MPKGSTSARDLILGLLFFGGLGALVYVTTQLRSLPGMGSRQYLNVLFEDVYGVRQEDSVLVHGTRYGRVSRVVPIPRQSWTESGRDLEKEGLSDRTYHPNVLMVIELEVPISLREGYAVLAEDSNLLGGKVVIIEPGDPERLEKDLGPSDRGDLDTASLDDLKAVQLIGARKPHPLTAIGEMVEDNLGGINEIVENIRLATAALDDDNQKGMVGYLLTNPESRERARNILESLDRMATQVGQQGTLMNDLFYESPLRNNLNDTVARAREFMDDAKNPGSLVGSLVTPESQLKQDVDTMVARFREFSEKANRPGSMLDRLVDDSPGSIGAKSDELITNLNQFVSDSRSNSDSLFYNLFYGDLGGTARSALVKFESLADSVQASILDPIQQSTGVLGYLINDPDAKKKVDRLVSATLGIIEDAREAAPITSLGSFIFGGF